MNRLFIVLLILWCPLAQAQNPPALDPDARLLMRETLATYRALSSYRDHGKIVQTLKASPDDESPAAVSQEFVTLFKRQTKFKFAWTTSDNFGGHLEKDQNAIRSDGTKVWASWSSQNHNAPKELDDFDTAVAAATGISQGMSHDIFVLLSDEASGFRYDELSRLRILGSETVHGIDCYIVRGFNYDEEVQLWIGKKDHLIHKGKRTLPNSSTAAFERTDIVVNQDIPDAEFSWHKR